MEVLIMTIFWYFIYLFNCNMFMVYTLNFFLLLNLISKLSFLEWWNLNLFFGTNSFSFGLIILSFMILNIIILNLNENMSKYLVFLMFLVMILNFLSVNLLLYYFLYESSLIMIFYLIMNWSNSMFKLMASYMLIFYTLLFSLPMLIIIIYLYSSTGSLSFLVMELNLNWLSEFMYMYLLLGFLVKIPMFLLHGWLLKAHVEATFFGSMILASIMLKLGGYGLLRLTILFDKYFFFKNYIIALNMVGMVVMSLLCLQQVDMKLLIAISSVVHMSLMICSMFTFTIWGYKGSYLIMLGHGFSSSGLFYLVNEIYKNSKTRLMILNKGIIMFSPIMTMMWFLMCTSNSASPLSMNLFSEIFLLSSLLTYWNKLIWILVLYCFFSFMYSIYLFSIVQHGIFETFFFRMKVSKMMHNFILLKHWIPMNIVFLVMIMF